MLLFQEKYLSKLKQHGLPDALSKEFSFKCLSVMIYEQFIVSIVELMMLPILLYNFHLAGFSITSSSYLTWLGKYLNFLKFGNCDLSDVTSFSVKRASYYRKFL